MNEEQLIKLLTKEENNSTGFSVPKEHPDLVSGNGTADIPTGVIRGLGVKQEILPQSDTSAYNGVWADVDTERGL